MSVLFFIFYLSISVLFLKLFNQQFIRRGLIDKVISRSSHNSIATRSGGISIFLALFIISLFNYFTGYEMYDYSILIPLGILFMVGLYDDLYNVDYKLKLIFQIITAKILIDSGFLIDNLHGVLGIYELNRIISQLFSIFIIVAIINSINFIDGIDGLAASVVALFIIYFEVLSKNFTAFFNLSVLILIIIIPFLFFNMRKENKVFLGDSGSLFLGGLVSIYIMHILSYNYIIMEEFDINKIFYVLSILLYPIFDISRVVFLRTIKGISPFKADKNHIHHFLLARYNNHFKVVVLIILFSLIIFTLIHVLI